MACCMVMFMDMFYGYFDVSGCVLLLYVRDMFGVLCYVVRFPGCSLWGMFVGSSVIVRVALLLCCMDRFDVVGYVLGLFFRVMVVWLGLG